LIDRSPRHRHVLAEAEPFTDGPRPEVRVRSRVSHASFWSYVSVLPYFVFGGFVLPLLSHLVKTIFARRLRLTLAHQLTPIIASYLVLNLWLVRPIFESRELEFQDFLRWQVREVVPLFAVIATMAIVPAKRVRESIRGLIVVGALLGLVALPAYLYALATSTSSVAFGLVRQDITGHYFFVAWLRAHNAAGGLYAILAVISMWWVFKKWARLWVFAGCSLGLVLTGSRSAFAALLVGAALLITVFFRGRVRLFLLGAFFLLIVPALVGPLFERLEDSLSSTELSLALRMIAWERAIDAFQSSPLVGVGWGNFESEPGSHAHNSYLHVLAELGLIGFGLLAVWVGSLARELRRRGYIELLAALAVVAVSALGEHNFGSPTITAPLFILVGQAVSSWPSAREYAPTAPIQDREVSLHGPPGGFKAPIRRR
jgi:O-antigen ligase